jgi:hypothetical protein
MQEIMMNKIIPISKKAQKKNLARYPALPETTTQGSEGAVAWSAHPTISLAFLHTGTGADDAPLLPPASL